MSAFPTSKSDPHCNELTALWDMEFFWDQEKDIVVADMS